MDFGLKEIGITFMVGAFTILGFELVLFYLCGINITGFFRERLGLVGAGKDPEPIRLSRQTTHPRRLAETRKASSDDSTHNMRLAVFIGLSFAIGILAEDISYKFVDNELPFGLESRYDTRVKLLIGYPEAPDINPLAKDLASNHAFEIFEGEKGIEIQRWILEDGACSSCPNINYKDVRNSIIKLYYYAKNNVYLEANFYDEMKKIQSRSDFTRSIAVISLVYFLIAFLLSVILLIDKKRGSPWISALKQNTKNNFISSVRSIEIVKMIVTFVLLIFIFFVAWWAYDRESAEFNKRAFGYFSSMLKKNNLAKQKAEGEKTRFIVEGISVQESSKK